MPNTTKLLARGIARGEIQRSLANINSLASLWQARYNVAGLVLFTADQVLKLEEVATILADKLQEQMPLKPNA